MLSFVSFLKALILKEFAFVGFVLSGFSDLALEE